MVRPRKLRRVCFLPGVTYFKPRGIPMRLLEEVRLSVDELEALRLKDLEDLEQEEAAQKMGISRQTFQRILEEAHRKVAESLVKGKALSIEGGDYEVVPMGFHCRRCGHRWEQVLNGNVPVACPNCEVEASEPSYPEREDAAHEGEGSGDQSIRGETHADYDPLTLRTKRNDERRRE